jgi:hypothetical protein
MVENGSHKGEGRRGRGFWRGAEQFGGAVAASMAVAVADIEGLAGETVEATGLGLSPFSLLCSPFSLPYPSHSAALPCSLLC